MIPFPFVHPCAFAGCDREGSFGEGCDPLQGIVGLWWCFEHWKLRQANATPRAPKFNQPSLL